MSSSPTVVDENTEAAMINSPLSCRSHRVPQLVHRLKLTNGCRDARNARPFPWLVASAETPPPRLLGEGVSSNRRDDMCLLLTLDWC
jgi:hypothetical protein